MPQNNKEILKYQVSKAELDTVHKEITLPPYKDCLEKFIVYFCRNKRTKFYETSSQNNIVTEWTLEFPFSINNEFLKLKLSRDILFPLLLKNAQSKLCKDAEGKWCFAIDLNCEIEGKVHVKKVSFAIPDKYTERLNKEKIDEEELLQDILNDKDSSKEIFDTISMKNLGIEYLNGCVVGCINELKNNKSFKKQLEDYFNSLLPHVDDKLKAKLIYELEQMTLIDHFSKIVTNAEYLEFPGSIDLIGRDSIEYSCFFKKNDTNDAVEFSATLQTSNLQFLDTDPGTGDKVAKVYKADIKAEFDVRIEAAPQDNHISFLVQSCVVSGESEPIKKVLPNFAGNIVRGDMAKNEARCRFQQLLKSIKSSYELEYKNFYNSHNQQLADVNESIKKGFEKIIALLKDLEKIEIENSGLSKEEQLQSCNALLKLAEDASKFAKFSPEMPARFVEVASKIFINFQGGCKEEKSLQETSGKLAKLAKEILLKPKKLNLSQSQAALLIAGVLTGDGKFQNWLLTNKAALKIFFDTASAEQMRRVFVEQHNFLDKALRVHGEMVSLFTQGGKKFYNISGLQAALKILNLAGKASRASIKPEEKVDLEKTIDEMDLNTREMLMAMLNAEKAVSLPVKKYIESKIRRLNVIIPANFFEISAFLHYQDIPERERSKLKGIDDIRNRATLATCGISAQSKHYSKEWSSHEKEEIGRSDTYRVLDNLPKNEKITIESFDEALKKQGVDDKEMRHIILCFLLQKRVGIAFRICALINDIALIHIEEKLKQKNAINVREKDTKIALVFNEDGSCVFKLNYPIYSKECQGQLIGSASTEVIIYKDKKVHFSDLIITFKNAENFSIDMLESYFSENDYLIAAEKVNGNSNVLKDGNEENLSDSSEVVKHVYLCPLQGKNNYSLKGCSEILDNFDNAILSNEEITHDLCNKLVKYVKIFTDIPILIANDNDIHVLQNIITKLTKYVDKILREAFSNKLQNIGLVIEWFRLLSAIPPSIYKPELVQEITCKLYTVDEVYSYLCSSEVKHADLYQTWQYFQFASNASVFLQADAKQKPEEIALAMSKQLSKFTSVESFDSKDEAIKECKEIFTLCKKIADTSTTILARKDPTKSEKEIALNLAKTATNLFSDMVCKIHAKKYLFEKSDFLPVVQAILTARNFISESLQDSNSNKKFYQALIFMSKQVIIAGDDMTEFRMDLVTALQAFQRQNETPSFVRELYCFLEELIEDGESSKELCKLFTSKRKYEKDARNIIVTALKYKDVKKEEHEQMHPGVAVAKKLLSDEDVLKALSKGDIEDIAAHCPNLLSKIKQEKDIMWSEKCLMSDIQACAQNEAKQFNDKIYKRLDEASENEEDKKGIIQLFTTQNTDLKSYQFAAKSLVVEALKWPDEQLANPNRDHKGIKIATVILQDENVLKQMSAKEFLELADNYPALLDENLKKWTGLLPKGEWLTAIGAFACSTGNPSFRKEIYTFLEKVMDNKESYDQLINLFKSKKEMLVSSHKAARNLIVAALKWQDPDSIAEVHPGKKIAQEILKHKAVLKTLNGTEILEIASNCSSLFSEVTQRKLGWFPWTRVSNKIKKEDITKFVDSANSIGVPDVLFQHCGNKMDSKVLTTMLSKSNVSKFYKMHENEKIASELAKLIDISTVKNIFEKTDINEKNSSNSHSDVLTIMKRKADLDRLINDGNIVFKNAEVVTKQKYKILEGHNSSRLSGQSLFFRLKNFVESKLRSEMKQEGGIVKADPIKYTTQ